MWIVQLSHDNGGDLTAVIALGAVLRASKTEKKRFVRIGARTLLLNLADTARLELHLDKAGKVEMGPSVRIIAGEKHFVVPATFEQSLFEVWTHFV